jgi:hypothetical protein
MDEWPWKTYPNYTDGQLLINARYFNPSAICRIQTTPMIPFEDVYLTGICSEKAGVTNQHSFGYNR